MKKASLSGSPRESVGKKDASDLRKEGRVPAVLYGGDQQLHLSVDEVQLRKLIFSPDVFNIQLDLDGEIRPCILRDIQYHPVTDAILHVDFLRLFDDKEIWIDIPVRTEGTAEGVINGGRLAVNHRRLRLRGLPGAIPEYVMIDVAPLDIGDNVRVRSLNIEGVTIGQADSDVIVAVKRTRAAMSAASGDELGEDGEVVEGEGEAAEGEEAAAE